MRALVLLLLSGCVLWLVLRGFDARTGEAEAAETAAEGGEGYFLPVEVAPEVAPDAPVAADAGPGGGQTSAPASPPPDAPQARSAAQPEVAAPPSRPAAEPSNGSSAGEVELARELAHRPGALSAWLSDRGAALPAGRRALALAVAQAIDDRPEALAQLARPPTAGDEPVGSPHELSMLDEALRPGTVRARAASVSRATPLVFAAHVARTAREADEALADGRFPEAAAGYSDVLQAELDAPWTSEVEMLRTWSEALSKAQRRHQWNRKGGWPSLEVTVERGDSLISLRKRVIQEHPELLLCTGLIERANELKGETIHPGQVLRIPRERARMLVDLSARWAVYFLGDQAVAAWEVGVGAAESPTPPGVYTVGDKNTEPMWFRPSQQPVPFGAPENPLGTRWIAWLDETARPTGLAFHGTKDPESIGADQSQGCVRMRNRDVEELFEVLPVGARIEVRN